MRALALADRYYLLIKLLNRHDAWHPWVYARCREVEANPDGYLDIWPREHFKSTTVTYAGIIQEVLRDPEITVGIFSHTKHIATGFLAQIQREFESNEKLKVLFPDVLYAKPDKESPSWSLSNGLICKRQQNPKEGTVEAWGLVDGMPTGRHFKLMVYDDVVTRESVNTPEQIAKTTEAWELSDNLGTVGGRKWMLGTRYSYGDTYQTILERGAAKPRVYTATHDGTLSGKPILMRQADWDAKVIAQGESTISTQNLCNPLAGKQRMFDISDLQVYEIRPQTLSVYIMVDPARSMKKDSANTAMGVIGMDYAGNKFLLDGMDHKMNLSERWTNMRDLWAKWKQEPGVMAVNVGYERYGAIADMDYFEERERIERISLSIVPLEWPRDGQGSKVDRVQRLGPDFRSHRFYLPYPTDPKRMTRVQREMSEQGYDYRVARPILRLDENGAKYDLSERFRMQVSFFPLGGLKDLVDAVSRIYDMDPTPPVIVDQSMLEPEYT